MIDVNGKSLDSLPKSHPVRKAYDDAREVIVGFKKTYMLDWAPHWRKNHAPMDPKSIPETPADHSFPITQTYVIPGEGNYRVTLYKSATESPNQGKTYSERSMSFTDKLSLDPDIDYEKLWFMLIVSPFCEPLDILKKWNNKKRNYIIYYVVDKAKDAKVDMKIEQLVFSARMKVMAKEEDGGMNEEDLRAIASTIGVVNASEITPDEVRSQLNLLLFKADKKGMYRIKLIREFLTLTIGDKKALSLGALRAKVTEVQLVKYYKKSTAVAKTGWYVMDAKGNRVDLLTPVLPGKKKDVVLLKYLEANPDAVESMQERLETWKVEKNG